jgi:hypothetical protein
MTPRLPVLLLALAAALLLVPSASASERSVVAAVRATAKPIERTSTQAARCPKAAKPLACLRKVGPKLAAAARDADRRIGAALDGSERRCFAAAVAIYRKGLRAMAAGGVQLGKGRFAAGGRTLRAAATTMTKAARRLRACG